MRKLLPFLALLLMWAAFTCMLVTTSPAPASGEPTTTTAPAPTTTTTVPPTTTTSPPVQISGQPCADSLSCQQVTAQDVSRLRTELLTGLCILVLLSAAGLILRLLD